MRRVLNISVMCCLLGGCTARVWYKDFTTPTTKLSPPKLQLLTLGMTKDQVVAAIGSPDQFVGAKMVDRKAIETWEYIRIEAVPGVDKIAERYQVIFTEGLLTAYESAGDFKQQINVR